MKLHKRREVVGDRSIEVKSQANPHGKREILWSLHRRYQRSTNGREVHTLLHGPKKGTAACAPREKTAVRAT